MGTELKTELQIPDLWFDFYARFLPGTVFIAAIRVLLLNDSTTPSVIGVLLLGGAGYLASLITYPITGWIAGKIHAKAATTKPYSQPDGYVRDVQYRLGDHTKRAQILGKQHGETAFFVQLAVLGVAYLVLNVAHSWPNAREVPVWAIGLSTLASIVLAWAVARRRVKRAVEDDAVIRAASNAAFEDFTTNLISYVRTQVQSSASNSLPAAGGDPWEQELRHKLTALSQQLLPRSKLKALPDEDEEPKSGAS